MNLPVRYTDKDLETARTKGQVVGWVQGGGAVLLGGIVLNLIGWIPTVLVVGGVTYLGYKVLTRGSKD